MDWKICAADDLRRYKQLKIGVLNSQDRLRLSPTIATLRLSPNGRHKRSDTTIINTLLEKEKLQENINTAKKLISLIERGLDSLSDEERRLLEKFYMNDSPSKMRHLSEEFGYEVRTLYRMRDRALAKFTIAMYGLEVS